MMAMTLIALRKTSLRLGLPTPLAVTRKQVPNDS